jgi:nicotinic acid mononucleotide adenylyltransferase
MGHMKNYRQLLKELPSNKVVFAFGRFQPPTALHELQVKVVKKLAEQQRADYVIYASKDLKEELLPVDKKVHYMNLMFPNTNIEIRIELPKVALTASKTIIAGRDWSIFDTQLEMASNFPP